MPRARREGREAVLSLAAIVYFYGLGSLAVALAWFTWFPLRGRPADAADHDLAAITVFLWPMFVFFAAALLAIGILMLVGAGLAAVIRNPSFISRRGR